MMKKIKNDEQLEEEIQNEIVNRVLKEDEILNKKKQANLNTKATINALEEITDVPHHKIEKTAKQVREEYNPENRIKKRIKSNKLYYFFIALSIMISFIISIKIPQKNSSRKSNNIHNEVYKSPIENKKKSPYNKIIYKAIFTKEIKRNQSFMESINKISINVKKIYLYIKWERLPIKTHDYLIKITDGAGSLAWQSPWKFTNKDTKHYTWSEYGPKKGIDIPGKWKFEVFLGSQKIIEKNLLVTK